MLLCASSNRIFSNLTYKCSFGNSWLFVLPSKMICELRTLTFHESNFVTRGTELLSNSLFRNKLNNHNLNETIARSYRPWRPSRPWPNLFLFLLRMISSSKGCSPLGIRIPGLYSYVRGYNLTQENACCLRLQPHLYPSMVVTGLGRGDELRHSRREWFELMSV